MPADSVENDVEGVFALFVEVVVASNDGGILAQGGLELSPPSDGAFDHPRRFIAVVLPANALEKLGQVMQDLYTEAPSASAAVLGPSSP